MYAWRPGDYIRSAAALVTGGWELPGVGTKVVSFGRATGALNHWANSPALWCYTSQVFVTWKLISDLLEKQGPAESLGMCVRVRPHTVFVLVLGSPSSQVLFLHLQPHAPREEVSL